MLRLAFTDGVVARSFLRGKRFPFPSHLRPCLSTTRDYVALGKLDSSSKASGTRRKAVTVVNDDGRVQWKDLTTGEKAARTTQQTFNFAVVLAGAVGMV